MNLRIKFVNSSESLLRRHHEKVASGQRLFRIVAASALMPSIIPPPSIVSVASQTTDARTRWTGLEILVATIDVDRATDGRTRG